MQIGELAERTGASRRLLRYYEEQGLISADRLPNGYRDYDDRTVDRVAQIRGLLESGLPTRIIRQILPCLNTPAVLVCADDATPDVVEALERERDRIARQVEFLSRNLGAISDYLEAVTTPRVRRQTPTTPSMRSRRKSA